MADGFVELLPWQMYYGHSAMPMGVFFPRLITVRGMPGKEERVFLKNNSSLNATVLKKIAFLQLGVGE